MWAIGRSWHRSIRRRLPSTVSGALRCVTGLVLFGRERLCRNSHSRAEDQPVYFSPASSTSIPTTVSRVSSVGVTDRGRPPRPRSAACRIGRKRASPEGATEPFVADIWDGQSRSFSPTHFRHSHRSRPLKLANNPALSSTRVRRVFGVGLALGLPSRLVPCDALSLLWPVLTRISCRPATPMFRLRLTGEMASDLRKQW